MPLHPLKFHEHMRRRLAQRRVSWLGKLPAEIWLNVIRLACDATLSSLARTCHAMGRECGKELAHRKTLKLALLRAAESSCPGMVLCCACVTFHARPSKRVADIKNLYWEIAPSFAHLDLGGPRCKEAPARVRLAKHNELDWWRAHLAMRSHRFSALHGPPISELNKITIRLRGLWTSSTEAVVHADHLLLKVQGFRLLSRGEDYTRHMPCCKHLKSSRAMLHVLHTVHDRFFDAQGDAVPDLLYRCSCCPFEFRLRIAPGDDFASEAADIVWRHRDLKHDRRGDGFMLCITAYVDLGRCVEPSEAEWAALAGDAGPQSAADRFHRPTIESRFEHHHSLTPLNYEEVAYALG